MSPSYPRCADARKLILRPTQKPVCKVCGKPATHKVFVEVNEFRGDDEGPFKVCKDHMKDEGALLMAHYEPDREGQPDHASTIKGMLNAGCLADPAANKGGSNG